MSSAPVSVVIPTHNRGDLLIQALDSILAQTLSPAEIIVVDDGSTDKTQELLTPFRTRIRYLHQDKQGPSAARNRGIAEANNEFVAFLDADDVWHPRKIELQMAIFDSDATLGLLGTKAIAWPAEVFPEIDDSEPYPPVIHVSWSQLAVRNRFITSSVIVRRKLWEKAGGFDIALGGAEDHDLWLRVAEHARVGNLPLALTGLRQVAGSLSRQPESMRAGGLATLQKVDKRKAWQGRWLLRRKAYSVLEYDSAYVYGAARRQGQALAVLMRSLVWYPFPYTRNEVGYPWARPKSLAVYFLRWLGIKPPEPLPTEAVDSAGLGTVVPHLTAANGSGPTSSPWRKLLTEIPKEIPKTLGVAIYSTAPPAQLHHLLRRILIDLQGVTIAGVIQFQQGFGQLNSRVVGGQVSRLGKRLRAACLEAGQRILRWFHAVPESAFPRRDSLDELESFCSTNKIPFQVRDDRSIERGQNTVNGAANLAILYGELPSGQRGAMPGLQCCLAAQQDWVAKPAAANGNGRLYKRIQIHRLSSDPWPAQVLAERAWPVEPFDTPASIELKAQLLGVDCFVEAIRVENVADPANRTETGQECLINGNTLHPTSHHSPIATRPSRRFKPSFKRPWYKLAARLLAYPVLRVRNRRYARLKRFPIVILFHHVITDRPKSLGISTEQFLKHVRFLKKHYRIASLPEAIEMLHKEEVPLPTVVLTFDDGYQDNFLCLRAVAEAENIPVTLFVCTKKVEKQAAFQHDLDRGELTFPALSWDQVRFLDRHEVVIGSHTQTHLDCGCTEEEVLRREIVGSLEDLRRELGHDVPYFSFPKGKPQNMSAPARAIAARAYPYLFSAYGGVNHAPVNQDAILKRCDHPDTLLELELLLQSVLNRDPGSSA